jgi:hypothetical protein
MPSYSNVLPPLAIFPGDVGFSFNNEAFPGGAQAGAQFAVTSPAGFPDQGRTVRWQTVFGTAPSAVSISLQGDLEWERSHNPMFITDLERRAARELGLDKPWLYDPKPMADCPVCAEKIKPGVAVCRSCGAILDREKAAQFGLVAKEEGAATESQRRGEKREREIRR